MTRTERLCSVVRQLRLIYSATQNRNAKRARLLVIVRESAATGVNLSSIEDQLAATSAEATSLATQLATLAEQFSTCAGEALAAWAAGAEVPPAEVVSFCAALSLAARKGKHGVEMIEHVLG